MSSYGRALKALKAGKRVARAGWNGKNMFVTLVKGAAPPLLQKPVINGVAGDLFERGFHGTGIRMPHLALRAADGSTVPGWLASQTDMLAEDWIVIDE